VTGRRGRSHRSNRALMRPSDTFVVDAACRGSCMRHRHARVSDPARAPHDLDEQVQGRQCRATMRGASPTASRYGAVVLRGGRGEAAARDASRRASLPVASPLPCAHVFVAHPSPHPRVLVPPQGLQAKAETHRSEQDFMEFIRKFQEGEVFPYREQLRKNTGEIRPSSLPRGGRHARRPHARLQLRCRPACTMPRCVCAHARVRRARGGRTRGTRCAGLAYVLQRTGFAPDAGVRVPADQWRSVQCGRVPHAHGRARRLARCRRHTPVATGLARFSRMACLLREPCLPCPVAVLADSAVRLSEADASVALPRPPPARTRTQRWQPCTSTGSKSTWTTCKPSTRSCTTNCAIILRRSCLSSSLLPKRFSLPPRHAAYLRVLSTATSPMRTSLAPSVSSVL